MIRAFSLTGIACLLLALFWYSRSGGARPEEPSPAVPAPVESGCRASGSCSEAKAPLPEKVETPPPPPPAAERSESPSREAFRKLAKEAWSAIPLKTTLQKRTSAELHYAPPELVTAAEHVGQIEEALDADPSLLPQGLKFFKSCAVNDEFPTSVRALCFHRLRGRLPKEQADHLTESEVPDDVRALADQLDQED